MLGDTLSIDLTHTFRNRLHEFVQKIEVAEKSVAITVSLGSLARVLRFEEATKDELANHKIVVSIRVSKRGVEQKLNFPPQVRGQFIGKAAEFSTSLTNEVLLLIASIVVIYIVLGVLYESYIHPLTIISTLPPAGVGALLALILCGMSLSVDGIVGIVLLIGIVKKNAIMMIDFAIEAQREGMKPHEAIRRACLLRFRPIMMTTAAAMLGALPLALGNGIGAELRRPLGVSIVGGLLLSQLVTLYTTPVIYLYMERFSDWLRERRERRALERAQTRGAM